MTDRQRRWMYQILALAWTVTASAHDLGVSKSDFMVDGQNVHAHFEMAERELEGMDGGPPDVFPALVSSARVTLGSNLCAITIERVYLIENDGIALDATYACPETAGELSIDMAWLGSMPEGHRHVAHLVSAKTALTALLTAEHRTASVKGTAPPPAPPRAAPLWPWIAGAAAVAIALAAAWRLKR
jgi:hypothetical protein